MLLFIPYQGAYTVSEILILYYILYYVLYYILYYVLY